VLLHLLAAVTAAGEWAAIVTSGAPAPTGTVGVPGPRAASEAGVELTRLAYVRDVPAARWATVVAALLDGCTAVVADPPPTLLRSDARRLLARVRQQRAERAGHLERLLVRQHHRAHPEGGFSERHGAVRPHPGSIPNIRSAGRAWRTPEGGSGGDQTGVPASSAAASDR
jgi:hypothetical protein